MLIVSNGAFKSGSTWFHRIAAEIVSAKRIPDEFQNPKWKHQSVEPSLFRRFLDECNVAERDYLSKNHVRDPESRATLLSHEHVRVLNITRDLRDVLVSAYFHDRREGRFKGGINVYWNTLGRRRINQVMEHHRLWNTGHSQVYVTSYEALKASFEAEVVALAAFLGIDDVDVEEVKIKTDFQSMRQGSKSSKEKDRFHRKGIVGDWQNHLSERVLSELAAATLSRGPTNSEDERSG